MDLSWSVVLTGFFVLVSAVSAIADRFVKEEPWDRRLDWITSVSAVLSVFFWFGSTRDFLVLAERVSGIGQALGGAEERLAEAEARAARLGTAVAALDDSLDVQSLVLGGFSDRADSLQVEIGRQRGNSRRLQSGLEASNREVTSLTAQATALSSRADSLRARSDELTAELALRPPVAEVMLVIATEGSSASTYDIIPGGLPDSLALYHVANRGGVFPRSDAPMHHPLSGPPDLLLCRINEEALDYRMWWLADLVASEMDGTPLPRSIHRLLYQPCGATVRAMLVRSPRTLVQRNHLWFPAQRFVADMYGDTSLRGVRMALVFRLGDEVLAFDFGHAIDNAMREEVEEALADLRRRMLDPTTSLRSFAPWELKYLDEERVTALRERLPADDAALDARIDAEARREVNDEKDMARINAEAQAGIAEWFRSYGVAIDLSEVYVPTERGGRWLDLIPSLSGIESPPHGETDLEGLTFVEAPQTDAERLWVEVARRRALGAAGAAVGVPTADVTWLRYDDGGAHVWLGGGGRYYTFRGWHRRPQSDLLSEIRTLLEQAGDWVYIGQQTLNDFELDPPRVEAYTPPSQGRNPRFLVRTIDLIREIERGVTGPG